MLTQEASAHRQTIRVPRRRPTRSTPTPTQNANSGTNDALSISNGSQERNPFDGVAPGYSTVQVSAWGEPNGSVEQILVGQGYSRSEIYSQDDEGQTLLDQVSRVNNLRNPNMVRQGQELMVPSKDAPPATEEAPQTEAVEAPRTETVSPEPQVETPTQARTETAGEANEPAVNEVTVDGWRQGPNDSLEAILKSQGFEEDEIYRENGDGDSLLKKVARANGLSSPDRIQAGGTLQVPNSLEALEQMNIPEAPARTESARTETPVREQEITTEQPAASVETNTEQPAETTRPTTTREDEDEVTANMGMLLNGVNDGSFTRQEFQYLNARSSRYAQMRARFAADGYSNEELTDLGRMETRYGVEFSRLARRDDIDLPDFSNYSSNPDLQLQVRHYQESGPLYDGLRNGTTNSEQAIQFMINQRRQARSQEGN